MSSPWITFPWTPWPEGWPEWTRQYEERAKLLWDEKWFGAADDLVTLVMGLIEYEREEVARAGQTTP